MNTLIGTAIGEIGKEEIPRGSNWGPDVQKYLKSIGIYFPASWCMAFVYWVFDEWYKQLGMLNPLHRTGGVMEQWHLTPTGHKIIVTQATKLTDIRSGDIMIQDHGHGLGHTGIVEYVDSAGIHTIEGNTNDTGSREGYEVCRKVRELKNIVGFIRLV